MEDIQNDAGTLGIDPQPNRPQISINAPVRRSNLHLSFQAEMKAQENVVAPPEPPKAISTHKMMLGLSLNDPASLRSQTSQDARSNFSFAPPPVPRRPPVPFPSTMSLDLSTIPPILPPKTCNIGASPVPGVSGMPISNAEMLGIGAATAKKKLMVLHLPPTGAATYQPPVNVLAASTVNNAKEMRFVKREGKTSPASTTSPHEHGHHHRHEGRSHRRDRLSKGFYNNIQLSGKLNISPELKLDFVADDLNDLGEIGRGGFGTVNKMVHRKTNTIMAVKRIRLTVDENEQKQLRDLEVAMWSNDCPFIVEFYGATLKEGDCWICMELMDTSLDKFYKFVYEKLNESIPENILGKVTVATLTALNYLKEKLKLIHRDVKPSNILLDRRGNIKLCDFGISGHLVDSIAKTRDAGCRPYMAPERIDPAQARGYDVRSDVWSLGITLMELSTGAFPYPKWNSVFEQLTQVVQGQPPRLTADRVNGNTFTPNFVNFVNTCLTKEESLRPKYRTLLEHPFVAAARADETSVVTYVSSILQQMDNSGKLMYTYNSYNY